MEWIVAIVFVAFTLMLVWIKRAGAISPELAHAHMKNGARIIDVRTPSEYATEHLPKSVNIPLNVLSEKIRQFAPSQDTVLLLHCVSGGRSGIGTQKLRRLGYKNAFNLGSYGRAERIVTSCQ